MEIIALIPNTLRDVGLIETQKILNILKSHNKTVLMENRFCDSNLSGVEFCDSHELMTNAEIIVVLGGDGTILDIAPQAAKYEVPILGVNLGNLGFLTQAEKGNYDIFDSLFQGEYTVLDCIMLDCCVIKNGKATDNFIALNDIVAFGDGYSRMVNVSASVNGTCIGTYSADGLIVATAVGSTAYSLSAGGAIMHPEMDAMILTPICPHTLKARSTIIPGSDEIEIVSCPPYRTSVIIMVDGKRQHILETDERLRITRSSYRTRLITANNRNFFDVLRKKLSD